jgi:hypothetical protein
MGVRRLAKVKYARDRPEDITTPELGLCIDTSHRATRKGRLRQAAQASGQPFEAQSPGDQGHEQGIETLTKFVVRGIR